MITEEIKYELAARNNTMDEKYSELVRALVGKKYQIFDELAILRKYSANPDNNTEEFVEYNNYVEQCKQEAKKILNI